MCYKCSPTPRRRRLPSLSHNRKSKASAVTMIAMLSLLSLAWDIFEPISLIVSYIVFAYLYHAFFGVRRSKERSPIVLTDDKVN